MLLRLTDLHFYGKKKEYYCKSCGEGQELLELKKSNNVLSLHEQRKRNQWIQDSTTNSETLKKRLYYCSLDPTTNSKTKK